MDTAALAKQLKIDEGVRLTVYADSLGYATVGCGHLVVPHDHLTLGQHITAAQCAAFLAADIREAVHICQHLWPGWQALPEDAQQVCACMAFQLGADRLGGFVHFRQAVTHHDWTRAAHEMRDSLWARQTPARAERLAVRMEHLAR